MEQNKQTKQFLHLFLHQAINYVSHHPTRNACALNSIPIEIIK